VVINITLKNQMQTFSLEAMKNKDSIITTTGTTSPGQPQKTVPQELFIHSPTREQIQG
jgi:hypothetical protein